jgi:alanine dehydrogenase
MTLPVFGARQVHAALTPSEALEAVRTAFLEHARGAWLMPSKVYVEAPPDGDFRAMPASGGGYAVLKWVTSFPGNPARGLPTVTGVVLLSDAGNGELLAVLDAGALTALRTGAAAVLAAETLARPDAGRAGVVGCGVNGTAVARTFVDRGRDVLLFDMRPGQAETVTAELGAAASAAADLAEVLACDVVATVTPGREPVLRRDSLRPGQHVSLMGADGPGKSEIETEELLRTRIVCDEWEQASHNGDIARAVGSGDVGRGDVAELGLVLSGAEIGRRSDSDVTAFDSTGLAVQDLAVARAIYERYRADPAAEAFAGTTEIELR